MSERVYPVRKPTIVATMRQAFGDKLEMNKHLAETVFQTDEVKPFAGYDRARFAQMYAIRMMFTDESQVLLRDIVTDPLRKLTADLQIPSIFSGQEDLPPHVTLQVGVMQGLTKPQINFIDHYLTSDYSHLNWLREILTGLTFHFDTLVVAPNTYICCGDFSDEQGAVYRARLAMEKMVMHTSNHLKKIAGDQYTGSFGLPPLRYEDIFHINVARIMSNAPVGALRQFSQQAYQTIGLQLSRDPLPMVSSSVTRENAVPFVRQFAPQLLVPLKA